MNYFIKKYYYILYIIINKKIFIKVIINILFNYIFYIYNLLNLIILNYKL